MFAEGNCIDTRQRLQTPRTKLLIRAWNRSVQQQLKAIGNVKDVRMEMGV